MHSTPRAPRGATHSRAPSSGSLPPARRPFEAHPNQTHPGKRGVDMQIHSSRPEAAGRAVCAALAVLAIVGACVLWGGTLLELVRIVFGGAVIAFLLSPLSRLLEKKLPRTAAALISIVCVALGLLSLFALLLPALIRQLSGFVDLVPEAFRRLRDLAEDLVQRLQNRIPELTLPKISFSGAEREFGSVARGAMNYAGSVGNSLYRFSLMAVLGFFLLADREQILLRMELLIPSAWRCLLVRTGNALVRELRLYLRGQATIALAVGILAAAALSIVGVPGAPLLGVFVGAFNVIPYLGPILGGVPAVILALSVSWKRAAFAILALFLVQQIDGMVISPRVMGNVTGFSPAVVLLTLYVGARLNGVWGMLLALPAMMAARTLYRVFVQRRENN